MRCTFCATGKGGFARNLAPHEIMDQALTVQEQFGRRVSNVGARQTLFRRLSNSTAVMLHVFIGTRHGCVLCCAWQLRAGPWPGLRVYGGWLVLVSGHRCCLSMDIASLSAIWSCSTCSLCVVNYAAGTGTGLE